MTVTRADASCRCAQEFEQELKSAQADSPDDKPKPPPAA
jgi:hypothetical protein